MKIIKKKYIHYSTILIPVDLTEKENLLTFRCVYFINTTLNKNYSSWLNGQLSLLRNFPNAFLYIIAIVNEQTKPLFVSLIARIQLELNKYSIEIHVDYYSHNEYEYRGLLKIWELSQIYNTNNDIILYFHSKGLTHHQRYEQNKDDNYNIILKNKELIEEIFTIFPTISKVGYSSSMYGWMWYNFWFARGSYLSCVEKPILTNRRHYYEDWLFRKVDEKNKYPVTENHMTFYKNTSLSCYSFYCNPIKGHGNIGSYYNPNVNKYFLIRL